MKFQWIGTIGQTGCPSEQDGQFNLPFDLKFNSERNEILVADCQNHRIQAFDFHSKQFKYMFMCSHDHPSHLLTRSNHIYIAYASNIVEKWNLIIMKREWQIKMEHVIGGMCFYNKDCILIGFLDQLGCVVVNVHTGLATPQSSSIESSTQPYIYLDHLKMPPQRKSQHCAYNTQKIQNLAPFQGIFPKIYHSEISEFEPCKVTSM